MDRRTPQERKRLSYLKDRRNSYGENDKSSRRNIRRNKAAVHSANRRHEHLVLAALVGARDTGGAEAIADRLYVKRPKRWSKAADQPLAEAVEYVLERRVRLGIDDAARARQRIHRIHRRLTRPH
ncbi:hypothetical protein B4N89_01585 [Embleya scabrispora]|uniref:Uncharacterized protein n=1 Tax=Embleya scabrispora TaxID=159449 RepID=A0A1T3NSN6_9ACTN|nr:hypothetical protein [Embleya scabrispora]OPC79806.1 hypothetical protein B4N89_01585 [Embleya scabrispora]